VYMLVPTIAVSKEGIGFLFFNLELNLQW
jgi:hypothetical protein